MPRERPKEITKRQKKKRKEKKKKIPFAIESKRIQYVVPKINVALTTYYKGTALEGVLSKLEEYLDTTDESESEINYL